jgi:CRISPR-associated endonuclease Cas2
MLYLIIYDITTDSIRTKIAKLLIASSFERLQFSVFLGLNNPQKDTILWKKFTEILQDEPEAKFYILPIPKNSIKNLMNIGKNNLDIDYLTGEKDSFFI